MCRFDNLAVFNTEFTASQVEQARLLPTEPLRPGDARVDHLGELLVGLFRVSLSADPWIGGFHFLPAPCIVSVPPGAVRAPRTTTHLGGDMDDTCGDRPLLGAVLVAQGAVEAGALDQALKAQKQTGERLGAFLLRLGLICRPELDRAVAQQAGTQLHEETGYGSGLRAAIERRHRWRRDLQAVFR